MTVRRFGASGGGSGAVDKSTVGLGNVDNTSDVNKPVSAATQTALDGKIPAIVLTPTGVAGTDGPAMDAAVASALATERPIYMRAGVYRRTTAWDCRGDGLQIRTDGPLAVTIRQDTDNVPILRVGGKWQDIGGMELYYPNPQVAANTSANAIEFYKSYMSRYGSYNIFHCARGFYMPQADVAPGTGNWVFSCSFGNVWVWRWTICALALDSYQSASTGNIFDNIYLNNDNAGAFLSADRAVSLTEHDELNIRQLNIEGVTITGPEAVLVNGVLSGKISGLHYERCKLMQWGSSFLNVYGQSKFTVDGMSVVDCPFASGAGGQADLLGIVKIGNASQLELVGLSQKLNHTITAASRPLVVGWDITDPVTTVEIRQSRMESLTTATEAINSPVGQTAHQFPVVKRLNNDWFHYTERGKHVTFGTAAPTTGTWAVGDKRWNTTPVAAGAPGWICTATGTPGTWKAMAALAA